VSEVVAVGDVGHPARIAGRSPWALAGRRLLRNRSALVALAGFVVIVVACLLAGWYAHSVAHTNPFESTVDGTTLIDGKEQPVLVESSGGLGLGVTPIGPTWDIHHYFLGADNQGRDVAARMLYGGRNSLLIATAAAGLCCFLATVLALIAGFFGGITDGILSRLLDLIWAFPVYLLAIAISTIALSGGLHLGFTTLQAGSLWIPILILGLVFVPYVARPIRGEVLSVREKEFVEAAIGLGASNRRLIFSEVLPNVITTVIVFFPLMLALCMLTEAALSFLSIGVQPPDASWGTIINDGQGLLYTRPWVAIAPGLAIAATVLCLNVLGDGVRDALDPRAKLRLGRQAGGEAPSDAVRDVTPG
jgi:peptide/nickel transport system permease protein